MLAPFENPIKWFHAASSVVNSKFLVFDTASAIVEPVMRQVCRPFNRSSNPQEAPMLSNKVSEIMTTDLTKAPVTASIFDVMETMVAEDVGRIMITNEVPLLSVDMIGDGINIDVVF